MLPQRFDGAADFFDGHSVDEYIFKGFSWRYDGFSLSMRLFRLMPVCPDQS
jgi:hypothetical protein